MMTIQRTVTIPADRRIVLDLPETAPSGKSYVTLTITPVEAQNDSGFPSIAELKLQAAEKTAKRRLEGRKPFEGLCGALKDSRALEGEPVEIVQRWRDGWALTNGI